MNVGDKLPPINVVYIFYQREANPGNCDGARGVWNRCGSNPCYLN